MDICGIYINLMDICGIYINITLTKQSITSVSLSWLPNNQRKTRSFALQEVKCFKNVKLQLSSWETSLCNSMHSINGILQDFVAMGNLHSINGILQDFVAMGNLRFIPCYNQFIFKVLQWNISNWRIILFQLFFPLKLDVNRGKNFGQHVVTVCAYQAIFLLFKISQHFERLLLDYLICLMLNDIDRRL